MRLYDHQISAVEYLRSRNRALLTDEMGLGKTISALSALKEGNGALVICPASLKMNWSAEATRWTKFKVTVLNGKNSFRLPKPGEIVIMNYAILPNRKDFDAHDNYKKGPDLYGNNPHITVIVDEAHYLKNWKSARTRKWRFLSKEIVEGGGRIWLMTGTPLITSPSDLWGVLSSAQLERDAYGNWHNFLRQWGGIDGAFGLEWDADLIKDTAGRGFTRVAFGRKREEVLSSLPSKQYSVINVKTSVSQLLADEAKSKILEIGDSSPTELQKLGELAKFRRILADAKSDEALPHILEMIKNGGAPVIVFSAHVSAVDKFKKIGGFEVITGASSQKHRDDCVNRFQDGKLDGLAMTIGAGGTGLTLTASCRMIFIDLDWSPSINAQAEDRICRIGQKNACDYFHIVSSDWVDQLVWRSITRKNKMIDNIGPYETRDGPIYILPRQGQ